MELYAIFRCGIHSSFCGGIFSTLHLAYDAAVTQIRAEKDDYHTYQVTLFSLNRPITQEPEALITLSREGEKVFSNTNGETVEI